MNKILALFTLLAVSFWIIQSPGSPPNPTLPPPFSATRSATTIPSAESLHTALADYRIAYLSAEDDADIPEVVKPEILIENFGVIPVHDAVTLIELNEEAPFEALIIDASALAFIDYEWIAAAFDRGVAISVINIYYPELPLITGRNCGEPVENWMNGSNFFITFRQYGTETTTKQSDDCGEIQFSAAQDSLDTPEGYYIFIAQLLGHLIDFDEADTEG